MSNDHPFNQWRELLALKPTLALIEQIRRVEPPPRLQSGAGNARACYIGQKMGTTIQAESHAIELAGIVQWEYVDECCSQQTKEGCGQDAE